MRLIASGSYSSIAWFKLADIIARGEKERALSVHKLLMYSMKDDALSYQLEGDILLCFDDESALDKYHIAANLYKKAGKFLQAASVYEHVSLYKQDEKILEALVDVYHVLQNNQGVLDTFSRFMCLCLKKNNISLLLNKYHGYLLEFDIVMQALLSVRFVRSLLVYDSANRQITSYIYQTVDLLKRGCLESELYSFFSLLQELHKVEYQKAKLYLDNNFE